MFGQALILPGQGSFGKMKKGNIGRLSTGAVRRTAHGARAVISPFGGSQRWGQDHISLEYG